MRIWAFLFLSFPIVIWSAENSFAVEITRVCRGELDFAM